MLKRKTAVNYAKALFAIPGSEEDVQQRQEGLERLVAILREHPQVLQILSCPELSVEDRLQTVEKLLQSHLNPILKQFLGELFKRRKTNYLVPVASEYHKLVVDDLKSLDVGVESFEPLSETSRQALLSKLEHKFKKKINLIESVNPELLSGFVLLIGNKQLDLSIKGKLIKLKQLILKGEA
jgi:F-type H+-transporting ATPase subunit delta